MLDGYSPPGWIFSSNVVAGWILMLWSVRNWFINCLIDRERIMEIMEKSHINIFEWYLISYKDRWQFLLLCKTFIWILISGTNSVTLCTIDSMIFYLFVRSFMDTNGVICYLWIMSVSVTREHILFIKANIKFIHQNLVPTPSPLFLVRFCDG